MCGKWYLRLECQSYLLPAVPQAFMHRRMRPGACLLGALLHSCSVSVEYGKGPGLGSLHWWNMPMSPCFPRRRVEKPVALFAKGWGRGRICPVL